jgi:AbrB family looped-hinge helix DNA binding protein
MCALGMVKSDGAVFSGFKSKLDDRGRIYIPKPVRERLFIKPGDKMYIRIEDESFWVFTTRAIQKQLAK